MTRMRAPFSSFSLWLSDLSSVKIWDSRREKDSILEAYNVITFLYTQWDVCESFRWYSDSVHHQDYPLSWWIASSTTNNTRTVLRWSLRAELWGHASRGLDHAGEEWQYMFWGFFCTEKVKEHGVKVKERETQREGQFSKSRSLVSRGAMTKNNHPLCQSISPLLETNNNPLL